MFLEDIYRLSDDKLLPVAGWNRFIVRMEIDPGELFDEIFADYLKNFEKKQHFLFWSERKTTTFVPQSNKIARALSSVGSSIWFYTQRVGVRNPLSAHEGSRKASSFQWLKRVCDGIDRKICFSCHKGQVPNNPSAFYSPTVTGHTEISS